MSASTTRITPGRAAVLDHRVTGIAAVVVGLAALAVANFVTPGDNGGAGEFAITGSFTLIVAALVFGLVVPRAVEGGSVVRTALILTAISGLGVVAFWSGLTQVSAPAAMLLGHHALQGTRHSRGGAWTAIVLSGLFYAVVITACVIG